MKSEDGTGSRHPCWRCGNVTPPISFISKMVTSVTIFFFFDYHLTTKTLVNFSKSPKSKKVREASIYLALRTF